VSIGQQGGQTAGTIINNVPPAPPPAMLTICVSESQEFKNQPGEIQTIFTLTTDSKVEAPRYNFWFDMPISDRTNAISPDMAMNIRETSSDSRFAFQIFQTWFPTQRINVDVRASGPVSLLKQTGEHNESFSIKKGGCNSGL
jgi:hypothetical protein